MNQPIFNPTVLKSIQLNFVQELKESMAGKKTSLPFILNSLSAKAQVAENEAFQVMVVGGSVFKSAIAKKTKGRVSLSAKKQAPLPILETKADFFAVIEEQLDPKTKVVALNFAYPLSPVFEEGKLDGILMSGTKEHSFKGLVGEQVGKALEKHFLKKTGRKVSFSVANDTVCLLLSGLKKAPWDKIACGIVGTGVNFAFFLSPTDLVNLESANFDKFPVSDEAKEVDLRSAHVGRALFEKETAGGYLFNHFNSIVAKKGLIYPQITSTWELKTLALQGNTEISTIAEDLIAKSAALIAAKIAGITLLKQHDMTFVMEGSFFWEDKIYKDFVEEFLKVLIPDFKVRFVDIKESHYLGAAKLVC